jgi:flagellar M-ring protein FliF
MSKFINQVRDALVNGWRNSRGADRLPYITILAGFALLLLFYFVWMTRPSWVFLMKLPDPSYAQRVTTYLDAQSITYKVKQDGIYVQSEEDKYRAQFGIADSGVATGSGGFDWAIFLEPKLGTTSDVLKVQVQQAKRASIERRLAMSPLVEWAIVHIDVPEDTLFDEKEPTASVTVKTLGRLSHQQVRAVQEIVASAQVGVDPERVRVTDHNLNLLSNPEPIDSIVGASATQLATIREYERVLEEKALAMLTPVVGEGKARVRVNLDVDFRDRATTSTEVDPDSAVLVTEDIETEEITGGPVGNAPGIPSNLPGEGFRTTPSEIRSQTFRDKTRTQQDYSRSETIDREIGPKITRLSASVLVDGVYAPAEAGGTPVFQARSPGELDELRNMVAAAVGFQEERDGEGAITIASAPFQKVEAPRVGMSSVIGPWLSSPRKILAPIVLVVLPVLCVVAYRKIDQGRQKVRHDFRRELEQLVAPLRMGKNDVGAVDFGTLDFGSLSEDERHQTVMQERLADHAKRNPKEFAQVIRAWLRD